MSLIPLDDFIGKLKDSGFIDELHNTIENRSFQFSNILPYLNNEFGTDLRVYTQACPVQVEGSIDGYSVYFRARWGTSRLEIGGYENPVFEKSWKEHGEFDASWLPPEKVGQYLYSGLSEYRTHIRDTEAN